MRGVELLHPETRKKADKLVELALKQGLKVKITDTLRTKEEQNALFAQGSQTTTLKYPSSVHSWGHAFDFCRNDGTGAYNENGNFFEKIGIIGESLGMEWGGRWKKPVDKPHLQDTQFLMGSTSASKLIEKYGTPEKYMKTWINIPIKEEIIIKEKDDDEIMYKNLSDVPLWGQPTIQKLIDKKYLNGNEKGELNLTKSMLRVFVVNDSAKLYD